MKYNSIRGMEDILPQQSTSWQNMISTARCVFNSFGYHEIILPVAERTEVFTRTLGDSSDIVNKEMYTFEDKKGRSLTLRPEGTASVVRAVIEHGLLSSGNTVKVFYIGPMFRYERPQKGRKRQFYQMGVEFFGARSYYSDCDAVLCMSEICKKLDIPIVIKINTLGCKSCLVKYTEFIKKSLTNKQDDLCKDCATRIKSNILRVFDCKNKNCKNILKDITPIYEMVCDKDKQQFTSFKDVLNKFDVTFVEDRTLVRGLDYYSGIIYEAYIKDYNSDAVSGGGRYNDLVSIMGGPQTPSVGFAIGIDRLIEYKNDSSKKEIDVFLVSLGPSALHKNFELLITLRNLGFSAEMEYEEKSPKSQFRKANSFNAKYVVVRGEDEIKKDIIKIKDMATGHEKEIKENQLKTVLSNKT
ncbi:MAG: histidine--tRNA ligase [Candidatus Aureabacteria bacterium]|nr:histidine--tRNA ligase [Candidatus Auribacterota bacterium]